MLYHGKRHPDELDGRHVAGFLAHLATEGRVSASTQNQAASALHFLYEAVLRRPIELPADLDRVVAAIEKHHGIAESMRPGPRAS